MFSCHWRQMETNRLKHQEKQIEVCFPAEKTDSGIVWELSWEIWRGMNSKPNENKTHTNPLISMVLPGNFKFFSDPLLCILLDSDHISTFLSECNFKFILQREISNHCSHYLWILESVAPQCLVKTGHDVNGGFRISGLQIIA